MRDLTRIWSEAGSVGHGFSERDTVVVDDTPRKMRHLPHNAVIVPEYDEAAVTRAARRRARRRCAARAARIPREAAAEGERDGLRRARLDSRAAFPAPQAARPRRRPAPKAAAAEGRAACGRAARGRAPAAAPPAAAPPAAAPLASAVSPEMAQFLRELAHDVHRATPKALGACRPAHERSEQVPAACHGARQKRDPARRAVRRIPRRCWPCCSMGSSAPKQREGGTSRGRARASSSGAQANPAPASAGGHGVPSGLRPPTVGVKSATDSGSPSTSALMILMRWPATSTPASLRCVSISTVPPAAKSGHGRRKRWLTSQPP